MEKVISEIDLAALTKALVLWNTGMDGENGGTCKITAELPWKPEWEKFMTWTEASEKFVDKAIGNRDESIYPLEYLIGYLTCMIKRDDVELNTRVEALLKLTNWASERANVIYNAYYKAIDELNKRIEASKVVYGMIEKFVGVDSNGFAKYEKVISIKDKNTDVVINRLWMIVRGLIANTQWNEVSFTHWLRRETRISIGESYYCHLGNKVTNS